MWRVGVHIVKKVTDPPIAGTLPVGLGGMLGVWFGLERCVAVGHGIVLQAVPAFTGRVISRD